MANHYDELVARLKAEFEKERENSVNPPSARSLPFPPHEHSEAYTASCPVCQRAAEISRGR
jgi:hypothetical protein